jgi:transposase
MARPPVFPAEEKVRIVLSILAGEITVAEAAWRAKVSEQSVGAWKRQLLEAGKSGLVAGKFGPSTREQQLEAEVTELT